MMLVLGVSASFESPLRIGGNSSLLNGVGSFNVCTTQDEALDLVDAPVTIIVGV